MEIRQTQKAEQTLALTPQLKKSLEILQKPALELREMLASELSSNPLLEDVSDEIAERPERVGESADSQADFDDDFSDASSSGSENDAAFDAEEKKDFFFNSIPDKISLREHLLNDAKLDAKDSQTARAFEFLLGFLDERGFLSREALAAAEQEGFGEASVAAATELLRSAEPAGIGAFDMRDSLMLQLERAGMGESLAHRILAECFELLTRRKVAEIAALEGVGAADVERAIGEIAKLSTSPARDFSSDNEHFVYPDLEYFKDENGTWSVSLTNQYIPRLRINPDYRKLLAAGNLRKGEADYIREKIRSGKFFMDAVEQRQHTLLRIGETILSKQPEFFGRGAVGLKPMTMQDVADIVELHPSTVGRAIFEKYADTPFGIVPLKSFFSGGYESSDGEGVASSSVKSRIKKIVAEESPSSPLSDSKIAEILADEGLNVARRTVAKYREALGIAPKNLRRRYE